MGNANFDDLLARLKELEGEVARLKGASPAPAVEGARPARRDLLRVGSLALGAAAVGLAPRSAEAANGDPIRIGQDNNGAVSSTRLFVGNLNGTAAFDARAISQTFPSAGLAGETESSVDESVGVVGSANATSGLKAGVFGISHSTDGAGVFGEGDATSGLNFGVWGQTESPSGYGVFGRNMAGHGVVGVTSATGGAGVIGSNAGVGGAYAGIFIGPVVVTGSHTVLGTKSAAVPHPDGSHRLLYCVESPESWFEDFGKGQLDRGATDVMLDPDFTAVADMDDYHVFVTPYNERAELMVGDQTPCGFRVSAKDGTSTARFSWRVVAKRKDVTGERFAAITIPTEPKLPSTESWKRGWLKNRSRK